MMITSYNKVHLQRYSVILPWQETEVLSSGNIKQDIEKHIPANLRYYLPGSIELLSDKEIEAEEIDEFLEAVIEQLSAEYIHRENRKQKFIELNALKAEEYQDIITRHKAIQPWILYYSKNGGLGDHDEKNNSAASGMIPCVSMRNHGVAWKQVGNSLKMWLVTSRKLNDEWDWDSDLGHESGHACFAPIPLFIQALHLQQEDSSGLMNIESIKDLTRDHIARLCYMITEIAVIAIRGERRHTTSGLPVAENPHEFWAFLNLANQLMPEAGFDSALEKYYASGAGFVDVNEDGCIYQIGAPCLRALGRIVGRFNAFSVPGIEMFSNPF